MEMSRWLKWIILVVLAVFVVAQAFRPSRTNPPINPADEVTARDAVPAETVAIFSRSCDDCHSNRTVWPWYSGVAPASWLIAYDVRDGRKELNLSEWGTYSAARRAKKATEICKEVSAGSMPQPKYTLLHPQAKLTSADVLSICQWTHSIR